MFSIDYKFDSFKNNMQNVETLDELTIRYYLFTGEVSFSLDEKSAEYTWEDIPLIDFAIGLNIINESISGTNRKEVFDFTDLDEEIFFEQKGNSIMISSSENLKALEVDKLEFHKGIKLFYNSIISDIINYFPEMKNNVYFLSLIIE